jgi:hypothetical protein
MSDKPQISYVKLFFVILLAGWLLYAAIHASQV